MNWANIYFKVKVIEWAIGIGILSIFILVAMVYLLMAVWSASKSS